MTTPTQTVELHQAFRWDCDECGRENFERAIIVDLGEDEARDIFGDDYDPEAEGYILMQPADVQCVYCGAEFHTELPGEDVYPADETDDVSE